MVLRQGLTLTGIGLAAGIAASFLVNRALASLLFNVKPNDPATLAGVPDSSHSSRCWRA